MTDKSLPFGAELVSRLGRNTGQFAVGHIDKVLPLPLDLYWWTAYKHNETGSYPACWRPDLCWHGICIFRLINC